MVLLGPYVSNLTGRITQPGKLQVNAEKTLSFLLGHSVFFFFTCLLFPSQYLQFPTCYKLKVLFAVSVLLTLRGQ